MKVKTGHVGGRRSLHFNSIDDMLADAESLHRAEREGRLTLLGNWSLGQSFGHLSGWVRFGFEGTPLKPPWIVRLIFRPMKSRMLYKPMRAGGNIPRVPGGTLATEPMTGDEGIDRMRKWFGRLKNESPTLPHIIFGPLSHDEWINLHLRHSELHLSFAVPQ